MPRLVGARLALPLLALFPAFAASSTPAPLLQPPSADPFEAGLARLDAGDREGALAMWVAGRTELLAAGVHDARIGTAFIRTATEGGLDEYRELATVMFYWGFSGSGAEAAAEEIMAEARRTFTLADPAAVAYWEDVGRRDRGELARAIKRYWLERDPTPATLVNERLVEHWERIADARRDFVYNRSSPYETDDRGTFYIRYGLPDRVTRGHLRVTEQERRFRNLPIDYIARFDQQPQYEIWRYATLHPGDFTYFLFGNTDGTGPFEHVEGLHEILPPSARVSGEARHQGIRAQYYLELFYYEDLARMGGPFGLRFGEIERLWNAARAPSEGILEATSRRHISDDQFAARQQLPAAISELDDRPRSALSAQAVRILEDGEPRLLTMAVSSPIWLPGTERDAVGRESLTLAPYTATRTVVVRDEALDEVGRAGMLAVDGPGHLATAVLRHSPVVRHLSVSAEHSVEDEEDAAARAGQEPREPGPGTSFDLPARLPGHLHFAVDDPLAGDVFEVSDLVVGIAPRQEIDLGELPVPLLPATQFWRADPVRVYFEVYRPAQGPAAPGAAADGGAVDVRVNLTPVDPVSSAIPLPDAEDLDLETSAITLQVESPAERGRHFFDLDLRNERAGLLRIVVQVTDRSTGALRIREAPVRLLER